MQTANTNRENKTPETAGEEELSLENISLNIEDGRRKIPLTPAILMKIYKEIKNSRKEDEKNIEVICDALNLLIKNTSEIPAGFKSTGENFDKLKEQIEKKDNEIEQMKKNQKGIEKKNSFLKRIITLLIIGMAVVFLALLFKI